MGNNPKQILVELDWVGFILFTGLKNNKGYNDNKQYMFHDKCFWLINLKRKFALLAKDLYDVFELQLIAQ